jgi:hypothetical protein
MPVQEIHPEVKPYFDQQMNLDRDYFKRNPTAEAIIRKPLEIDYLEASQLGFSRSQVKAVHVMNLRQGMRARHFLTEFDLAANRINPSHFALYPLEVQCSG